MTLIEFFEAAAEQKASDIHLASGEVPCMRIAGDLVRMDLPPLDQESLADLLAPMMPSDAMIRLGAGVPVEKTMLHGDLAFVGIIFRVGSDGLAATIRIISKKIPGLDVIGEGAVPLMESIVETRRGLVLICGPTGSGKWTTACSLVDAINARTAARIFVVEAHPSFRFESKKGLVTQLHVGEDCESYVRAMEVAHQADLDVIAVDDIPTAEALRQALMMADVGHLVIANLHADNVADALRRLEQAAGTDLAAFRRSLAQNLVAMTGQRLFKRASGKGRVPAYEWLTGTPAIREAILSGDLQSLSLPQEGRRTVDEALDALIADGSITEEMATLSRTR